MSPHLLWRGAVGGLVGAAVWVAAGRPLQGLLRTRYSDVRVAGAGLRLLGLRPPGGAAAAAHLLLGTVGGTVLARLVHGSRAAAAVAAAEAELLVGWPVVRRIARAEGRPFDTGARAFAEAAAGRALYAAVVAAVSRR